MLRHLSNMQRLLQSRLCRLTGGPPRAGWAQALPAASQTLARDCRSAQQPARHLAAAAASGSSEAAAPPPTAAGSGVAAANGGAPSFYTWRESWRDFLKYLHAEGHYAADPGVTQDAVDENAGGLRGPGVPAGCWRLGAVLGAHACM